MKKAVIGIATGVMVLGIAGLALAFEGGPGGFGGPEDPGVRGEAMQARFIARMQDKLGLDDATTAKITSIFKKHGDQRKDLRASMKKDVAALKEVLDTPKFDETKLTPVLNRMSDTRTKLQALMDSEIKEVRALLTPTQQAKAVIQMAEMKDKMKKRFHHGPKGAPEGRPDGE